MDDREYLGDSSQWGNYQYVGIEQVINDYLANRDEDDYTATTPRHKILYQAMRGVRELYYDVMQEIKAVELELSSTLMVTLPPDYVNYVRISWVDDAGMLHPMTANRGMNVAKAYLQDHEFNILTDGQGCIMRDSGTMPKAEGTREDAIQYTIAGFTPNLDLAQIHKNGSFRLDKENGTIHFTSDAEGKSIVLEYISDGLAKACDGGEIKVHKFTEESLINFIYYSLIKQRRNVPYNEKKRARDEYFNSRRISKRRLNTLRKEELIQAFSGSTKWNEPPM